MAYTITTQCIECVSVASPQVTRCHAFCPTGAIQKVNQHYQIDPIACNNCAGAYNVPQCWAACPTNSACIPDAATAAQHRAGYAADYWDSWFVTYNRMVSRLKTTKHTEYWQRWFDAYSSQILKAKQVSGARS
jgi:Fe-S-cluster-containing hydrogenase component 2